ncbi:MAG: amidohydrolase family protein [Clostridiales bacterium]|nr:amidohydrolase family protein [Clostridiales bacterium]
MRRLFHTAAALSRRFIIAVGTVEPGKQADLVIWDAEDLDYLVYRMGSNLAKTVIRKGNIVK